MKNLNYCLLTIIFLLYSAGLLAQISIGGYNVYYGSLHNHSDVSDGTGTPATAYDYAKNTSHLDFFSLADHSGAIESSEWTSIKSAANTYNEDGVFAAFWGFEWSSSGQYGHVAVINTDDYCTISSPTNTFDGLCTWLNSRDCVAFFNHPGRENSGGIEFSHFSTTPSDKLVGMELWNKAVGFSTFYYNDGYYTNDGNKGYFDEAITRNWKIGASGSEDNHSGNWGNYCNYRMAVLANAKTRTDIYAAFQSRRFFSTLDKNIALSFKINGSEMGSTVIPGNYTMQVQATDADGEVFTTIKLVKNGVVINTWTPNSSNPDITQTLTCSQADYFYVIIKEADNDEAISSPVWCSGTNSPPSVSITSPVYNAWYDAPAVVSINATAADNDGSVAKVEFYESAEKIGEDVNSPYSFDWINVPAGTYVLTAVAIDNLDAQTTSSPVTINVLAQGDVLTSSVIANGSDDAEESAAGVMYITSTDIELVYDSYNSMGNQTVGLRFQNLGIPGNAVISSAFMQFTADEAKTGTCTVYIKGEASDNSAAFTSANFDVSARPRTTGAVEWSPDDWMTEGETGVNQRTPDLKDILQEIVNRPGYTSASAVSMIITGTGTRSAEAYEGPAGQAAKLYVTFSAAPEAYCSSKSTDYSAEYISKFTLGTFINTSTGSCYSDFTSLTISLQASKKYTVIITPKFSGNKKQEYFKVWIDYNNDFDFDDAGENVITGMKNAEYKTTFTTPADITGSTRLRVAMKRVSYSGSCETFTYGEVEDYTVSFGNKSFEIASDDKSFNHETDFGLMIYPNPATQNLYCKKMDEGTCELEIYSIQGQLVLKSAIENTLTTIDISKLNHGLYLIKYVGREGNKTKKLVVY